MNLSKSQLIIIGIVLLLVLVFALIFIGILPGLQEQNTAQKIEATLVFWGIGDTEEAYSKAISNFKTFYPGVEIKYRRFDSPQAYRKALIESFAAGEGPDIFIVENNSILQNVKIINPVPTTKLSSFGLRQMFPETVAQSFLESNAVYALPLSIDTLALIYNRSLLDQAAVPVPETWEDFETAVAELGSFYKLSSAESSGPKEKQVYPAAIGGSNNTVDRASDVLKLLFLQTGTQFPEISSREGKNSLSFYTRFADAKSNSYAWNETLPNSLDFFSQGRVAMMFNYASALERIKARNVALPIGIALMPQPFQAIENVNYARYWGYTVSKQSKNTGIAWDFVVSLTTNPSNAEGYMLSTKNPPALRSLIQKYRDDGVFGIFARQALTATSFIGFDESVDSVLSDTIRLIVTGGTTFEKAVEEGERRIKAL